MSSMRLPEQFRAAQWTERNGQLQIQQTKLRQPEAEEAVIKVHMCGLHSTDEMLKFDLLPDMRYPMIPGGVVVGEVVQAPKQAKHGLKEGMRVVAVPFQGGCAEYCIADESMTIELPKHLDSGNKQVEAPVFAFDATRVWVAHERCQDQWKRMPESERRLAKEINERMGFKGDGLLVVYGEGGFARLALDTLKMAKHDRERKIILVAPSDKWSAGDYGLKDDCMLVVGKHNLADELKKRGGAQGVMCVDMPMQQLEELLDGCRFHSSLVMLSPRQEHNMQVPIANILAKSMTLHGQPLLTRSELERVLSQADKHGLRAPVKQYRFDDGSVREAWTRTENRDQFECSVVVMEGQGQ